MSQNAELAVERVEAQIPLDICATIDRAAAMQGITRADFLVDAALEKAERLLGGENVIHLSARDQEILALALLDEKVEEPNAFIKSVFAEYKQRVTEE